jgi:hypothetical protein
MDLENMGSHSFVEDNENQIIENDTELKDFSEIQNKTEKETPKEKNGETEIEQNLYQKVLEKLNIKEEIQEKSLQPQKNNLKFDEKSRMEKLMAQDFERIEKLIQSGVINFNQGQDLKTQVLKKAFDNLVQTQKIKQNISSESSNNNKASNFTVIEATNKNEIFEEFNKNNPNFFDSQGRQEVLNYLKSDEIFLNSKELTKISDIIHAVEKSAVEKYIQKLSHEKILKNSNENAKQKLTTNAQKSTFNGDFSKSFTREQIGKMSSTEFLKYENIIMEQLKKGLIH